MTAATNDTAIVRQAFRRLRVPQSRRNRELLLLLLALAMTGAAIALVQLGALGAVDTVYLTIATGVLAGLTIALHIVLRFAAPAADPIVVPVATLLTGLGLAMIYRIDIHYQETGWGADSTRQLVWATISVAATIAVVIALRNYRVLFRYTYLFGLAGILLLLLPFVPGLGNKEANADVWITIAGVFSFQPGEIAKLCLAIFFAGYLVRTRDTLASVGHRFLGITWPRARDLGPLLVIWLLSLGIIVLQRDLGTGLLMFGLFVVMLYAATGKTSWVVIGLLLTAGGAFLASRVLPYVATRFNNWLNAFDPDLMDGDSFQLVGGIFGLAHGGLTGTGLGLGRPYLTPLSQSDYIIPSLGEELGLIGVFAILALYLVFISRGLRIGVGGQDDFGKLLATGLAFTLALQVFIMVGGVTRLIPLTGLTTPFLAAGGSSLVANWIIVALLLRISDSVRAAPRVVIG